MNATQKAGLGVVAAVVIGLLTTLTGAVPGSARSIENTLQAKVDDTLAKAGFSWAKAEIDGQKAAITGAAPSPSALEALQQTISEAGWNGGLVFGAVTAVDLSGLSIAETPSNPPPADPIIWISEFENNALVFSGDAPNESARAAIEALSADLFASSEISGSLEIASRPAPNEPWVKAASAALNALSVLEHGAIEGVSRTITLTGEAINDDAFIAARTALENVPSNYSTVLRLAVRQAPPAANAPEATPETPDKTIPEVVTANCIDDLLDATRDFEVTFRSERAALDDASKTRLSTLAEQIIGCPAANFLISGHTDSRGSSAGNQRLSERRANAVRAYLISLGAPEGRLTARGFGETTPLASNATLAGRSLNRRIEIDVVSEAP